MQIEFSLSKRLLLPALSLAVLGFFTSSASAQDVERIVVTGDDVASAYGAPGGFSRARFSPTTSAYVLPPWTFYFGTIYQGDAFRHDLPDHLFTQEVEMGLPYRFGLAAETELERFNGGGGFQTVSLEGRYALADWNKIPLNPTLFADTSLASAPFVMRKVRHRLREKKRKRVVRPKYQMHMSFVSCWRRTSVNTSSGQ